MANPSDRKSFCDTGASDSLTGDIYALCCFRKLTRPITLSVVTNTAKQSFVTGVDSLIYPGYHSKHVIINGVFYSPDPARTLISPGAELLFVGMDILIGTKAEGPLLREVYNGNGWKWQLPMFSRLLACAIDNNEITSQPSSSIPQSENISTISLPLSPICNMTIEPIKRIKDKNVTNHDNLKDQLLQWHCVFGHIGLGQIQQPLGKLALDCLSLIKLEIHNCVHCLLAKSLQCSSASSTNRSVEPLELVVSDLMGPLEKATINRGCYTLNICDVSSTYGECHILENKSDATICLQGTILCWQRLSGKRLKILCTDNGGKLNNNVLEKWLCNKGMHCKV
ncbi:hypothetical protein O181_003756 [Austropuccinia psidii MF-1]|uniref:Integrase catalytic domain-containing protein n=1 Tax=Austropuccinia psidii MF-1 TaxID=1389203 RepID=A0A9Q3BE93_9BASI|nr:hypothetical protein [Austropuccinia psidii MF-1]